MYNIFESEVQLKVDCSLFELHKKSGNRQISQNNKGDFLGDLTSFSSNIIAKKRIPLSNIFDCRNSSALALR